jgi:hypothetical protein
MLVLNLAFIILNTYIATTATSALGRWFNIFAVAFNFAVVAVRLLEIA